MKLYREDYHFAMIACILYNAYRDQKKSKAATVEDFMMSPPQGKREQTPEEIREIFGTFMR